MTRFEDLSVGDVVVGEVTAVVPFGVFVRIADGADGLASERVSAAHGLL